MQAALPYLREQGTGHIIQMSSGAGLVAMPIGGAYHASKWALEALNDSLAQEVAGFGIKVTVVEPAGDPAAAAQALLKIVYSEQPPLRVLFGQGFYPMVRQVYADRLKTWEDWQDLSAEAHGTVIGEVSGKQGPSGG